MKLYNKNQQTSETEEHPHSVITTAKSADRPRIIGHAPHFTPQSVIPYPPSIFIAILWFSSKYDTPHAHLYQLLHEHHNLLNYSNTPPPISTQPINFANTNKTISSELPQPTHTASVIHDTTHDISLLSDTSNCDPISAQFSSPTASQISKYPFNPPQEQITNFERLLSQAHWNHSFNLFKLSPSSLSKLTATQFSGYTTHYHFKLKFTDTRS